MAFNAIVLKTVISELNNLIGFKVDKVNEPDKNTIVLGLYGKSTHFNLLSSISSNNFRFHLTNHQLKNPSIAPNFCMLLRKHIIGFKIKQLNSFNLERIVFIELENTDNPNKSITKKLIIELMGKHSNIILTDENNIIIDSMRHTTVENNAQRDIYPTSRYIFPKENDFKTSNALLEFYNKFEPNIISMLDSNTDTIEKIYNSLETIINNNKFKINIINNKDYNLIVDNTTNNYSLNYSLDNFYFDKESNELFINYRNRVLTFILGTLKKYEKRLINIDNKITECNDMDKYKLYGELITANLYRLPTKNSEYIEVENYYDNCNIIKIPLDKRYFPSINAKRYFKKYNKLKNALEIVNIQKEETLSDINYIESVIYELENCLSIEDIQNVYEEIEESDIFKNSLSKKNNNKEKNKSKKSKNLTKNKFASFNPLKYTIDGYTILVGRNNKENDFLTTKFAKHNDIWFHTKDIHGSHVILKTNTNETIPEEVIYETAKLAAKHSKAKNSSNIPVDYCQISNVKKPNGSKPGMVIYKNNKTIIVK